MMPEQVTHPVGLAGTYGDGCHADVIESGRNGGVAVWDYTGKHARKRRGSVGKSHMIVFSPKRAKRRRWANAHVHSSRDFGLMLRGGEDPKSWVTQPSITSDEVTLTR